ncbi:MAG: bifunctional adenosylcobinamide kinase/adenosylcobinamide-phosphate guanylyltransferase [Holophagales bacterium]|jgi:adenosyl cobinamide kinase/adenosyl cobinamide phosphate guanylyltransferase|nr:bifunctional adenosylcobinamide kinase/adenosylcobinamide-phosphate guanylyltransferase [Holophagales bacterium]
MILIFGGAYQGKLGYALDRFQLTESDVCRCGCDNANLLEGKKLFYEIDKWVLALVKMDVDVEESLRRFIDANPDAIVICNDISCGVVPTDPIPRKWREAAGKSLAMLSRNSHEIIRLFCGIPERIV